MTTTTEKKAPKVPTFYRTVTITTVNAKTADGMEVSLEIGGDVTVGQAIKRFKESEVYKKRFAAEANPEISVIPRKEEREITIDDFLKYSTPRTKPEPKVEQVKADIPATK